MDIFGDLGELQELFARRDASAEAEAEYEVDEEEEEDGVALEDEDEDALDRPDKPKTTRRKKRGGASAWQSVFEPSIVREQMLTSRDDEIVAWTGLNACSWRLDPEDLPRTPRWRRDGSSAA